MSSSVSRPQSATAALLSTAISVTPHASQTLSKSYLMQSFGSTDVPLFIEKADGAWVTDVEGRSYLDYPMALGPVILGHNHPKVVEAIEKQLRKGVLFSLPSPLEVEVAEAVTKNVPSADAVKFLKTGSEACSAAVRIARAVTGREVIAVGGFHGWHDFYAVTTTRSGGIPAPIGELTIRFRFNDIDSLEVILAEHGPRIAAVMLEPATTEPPSDGFLQAVADMSAENGSILIFDEVITGFRWAKGGAQERYEVYPDLTVLGKALGNGMPIAAVCGKAEVMEACEKLFVSGTYGGECLSLAAAKAVIGVLEDEPVIEYIWDMGKRLKDGLENAIEEAEVGRSVLLTGEPPRISLSFPKTPNVDERSEKILNENAVSRQQNYDDTVRPNEDLVLKSIFQQQMARREILFNGSFFVSYAHTDADIEKTTEAAVEAFRVVAQASSSKNPLTYLEGEPMASVF